jgi:menaquinol-cytochrome c reductase iron-sulfur subunit
MNRKDRRAAVSGGGPGRRGFLGWLTAASAAFVAAAAGLPLAGAIFTPLRRRAGALDFVRVARLDALPEGRAVRASIIAAREDAWARQPPAALGTVWLIRRGDAVTALSSVCPHLGCGVEAAGEGFACPCHGSAFDREGRVLGGPAPRGLDPLEVRVTRGEAREVEVRYQRFAIGTSARRGA